MNTIIIPVDFSSASENAMHYGAKLAQQIGSSVLLAHIYQMPIGINDVPVMVMPVDELKNIADTGLERCRVDLLKTYSGLDVKTESRLGAVYDGVNDLCEELNPFAVVIGSSGISGIERMLFGSTALSVIRHSSYPVFAIPASYSGFSIKNIVLAADLQENHPLPQKTIAGIVQKLNANLHLVHVAREKELNAAPILEKFQPLQPEYHQVLNENVKEGLLQYVSESGADLLMILPHEHNIMERLFFKLHTEDIIASTRIPVIAIRC